MLDRVATPTPERRASHDDYENSYLPTGLTAGTAEDALDCACNVYPGAFHASPDTPTNR